MIISRTPFRISFFGGGTDYPEWYRANGGSVLATSIDKYCWIFCRYLPPFFEHRLRIVYSNIELCQTFEEVRHPAVRETLRLLNQRQGIEIHHNGDLPARSGMGSSSSFTVGLLHALYALRGKRPDARQLAMESIHIEQEMARETVGSQDQFSVAFGGLNRIDFHPSGEIDLLPLSLPATRAEELNRHLMLFYTGIRRTASDVAGSYVKTLKARSPLLKQMGKMVDTGISFLTDGGDIRRFGDLLHEAWMAKRQLSPEVSSPDIDRLYELSRQAGAIGGKIVGAGGGGFLLLFVPPENQEAVREKLTHLIHVPFHFESEGSRIIFQERGADAPPD
jgi:D-glycero-alpha-D-manno-heptose-7-phosphate kinase